MEPNNETEEFQKHGTLKFVRASFLAISLIAIFIFVLYLPYIWWELTWSDLFTIAINQTLSAQLANKITQLTEILGITSNNLQSWAIERIFICIAIGIGIFILIYLISLLFKQKSKNA